MLEVGDGDNDGFDVFAVEEFAVVARGGNFGAIRLYAGFAMHVVEVGDADELGIGQFARRAEKVAATDSSADGHEAHLPIGWGCQSCGFEQNRFACGASGCSACAKADELPA